MWEELIEKVRGGRTGFQDYSTASLWK
jgi:hypothetical protein